MKRITRKILRNLLALLGEPQIEWLSTSQSCSSYCFNGWAADNSIVSTIKSATYFMRSAGAKKCAVFCASDIHSRLQSLTGLKNWTNGEEDYLVNDPCLKSGIIKIEWRR